MLPGFRFAFATILLTVSVLIFGLGAAALLRASYDRFVELPSAQLPHESTFARDQRTRHTTLALLRVEMAEQADAARTPSPAPVEATAAVAAIEPEPPTPPVVTPMPANVTVSEDVVARTPSEGRAKNEASSGETPPVTAKAGDSIQIASTEAAVAEPPADAAAGRPPEPAAVCIPATLLGMGAHVALLVDPAQTHPEIAVQGSRTKAAKASRSGKSAVHRARRARLRHAARLRRHRLAMRAPIIAAPPLGSPQHQPQTDPFLGFGR